jgi:hypothetical protein
MATTLYMAMTAEPAILDTIISYLPDNDQSNSKPNAALVLRTIVNLCRALPRRDQSLAQYFSPANQVLWRTLVLRYFDFTVDPETTLNVEDYVREWERDEDDELCNATFAEWERENGEGVAPESMLVEDLHYWKHLNVYFRPSQYQFLTDIQQGKLSMELWPTTEDAFTLFKDLAIVVNKFACFGKYDLCTFSDGEQNVYPCLLSVFNADVNDRGYALLRHCGVAPHYWGNAETPVSECWPGFDMPYVIANGKANDDIFPMCSKKKLQAIKRAVHAHMRDWRHVQSNFEECCSPAFYIGKSKYSGRWYGFVGQRDY